jgi:hypothetical protein
LHFGLVNRVKQSRGQSADRIELVREPRKFSIQIEPQRIKIEPSFEPPYNDECADRAS